MVRANRTGTRASVGGGRAATDGDPLREEFPSRDELEVAEQRAAEGIKAGIAARSEGGATQSGSTVRGRSRAHPRRVSLTVNNAVKSRRRSGPTHISERALSTS